MQSKASIFLIIIFNPNSIQCHSQKPKGYTIVSSVNFGNEF